MADLRQTIRAREQELTKLKIQSNQDKLKKLQSSNLPVEDEESKTLDIGTEVVMVKPPGETRPNYPGKDREGQKGKIVNIDTGNISGLGSKTTYHIRLNDGTPKGKLITSVQPDDFKPVNSGEDAEEKKHNWKTSSCEKCKRARYIADHVDKDEWPDNMKESTNIANFLKAISQKNYAQADKYLQGTVESKLKASINRAIQNLK